MPFVRLCDFDPAFDLVALVEKMTVEDEKEKSADAQPSPLANLVEEKKYTELLEQAFFTRIEKILACPENEVEASFSLCFSLLHTVEAERVSDMILRLATALSQDHTTFASLKLQLLCQLFNLLDTPSPLRRTVFLQMLRLALDSDNTDMVTGQFTKIDQWMSDWKLSDEQQGELFNLMSQCHKGPRSKVYCLKYLKTFESADAKRLDTCVEQAITAVKDAIADTNIVQCDQLLALAAVGHLNRDGAPSSHKQLHRLFSIFATGTAADYAAFASENKAAFTTHGLDEQDGLDKIRRLSLISACLGKSELTYAQVQEACALANIDDVEEVVIDTVGAGSLDAKLDQDNSVMQIRRVDQRTFSGDAESWGALGSQLNLWSQNIQAVLNHMSQNRTGGEDGEDEQQQ